MCSRSIGLGRDGEAICLSHNSKPPRCAVCGFAPRANCHVKSQPESTFSSRTSLVDPSSSLALPISTYTFSSVLSVCPTHCILRLRQSETPKEVSLATTPISRQVLPCHFVHTEHWPFDWATRLYHNPLHLFLPHATCVRFQTPPLGIVTTTIRHITAHHRYIPRQHGLLAYLQASSLRRAFALLPPLREELC